MPNFAFKQTAGKRFDVPYRCAVTHQTLDEVWCGTGEMHFGLARTGGVGLVSVLVDRRVAVAWCDELRQKGVAIDGNRTSH